MSRVPDEAVQAAMTATGIGASQRHIIEAALDAAYPAIREQVTADIMARLAGRNEGTEGYDRLTRADERRKVVAEVVAKLREPGATAPNGQGVWQAADFIEREFGGEPEQQPWCTCGAKTPQGQYHKSGCPARERAES